METVEKFENFEIARGPDGHSIELPRSTNEVTFLAFDTNSKRLVELHVLRGGEKIPPAERHSVYERAKLAADIGAGSLMHIQACGEDGELVYFTSTLNDGEWLEDYLARRGALPAATAFSLILELVDELLLLRSSPRLLGGISLERLMVSLQEETYLQLRIVELGLSTRERRVGDEAVERNLVHSLCHLLFQLLTGKNHTGEDCDRYPVLTGLPGGLRAAIRASLASPDHAPSSLASIRDEVRDALGAQTRDLQGRAARKHLVATDAMVPVSSLGTVLLHNIEMEKLMRGSLQPEAGQLRYPFMLPASDARTGASVTVHFLPPRRIVSDEHYLAVPLQMWRFNADKHPNILRSLSVWESSDLTFLTEGRGPGFPLSRILAERVSLNASEVLLLLRQVKRGLDQGVECGVEHIDIHPSNITLRLAAPPSAREGDRLLQKRLDAWPKFAVMLRPHMTMRGLYEPLLVSAEDSGDGADEGRDFRARSFVALAAYLLTGERQRHGVSFPDAIPSDLAVYVASIVEQLEARGRVPSPQEFLAEYEKRAVVAETGAVDDFSSFNVPQTSVSAAETPTPVRRLDPAKVIGPVMTHEPMESAGSVSDFDEDQTYEDPSERPTTATRLSYAAGAKRAALLAVPTIKYRRERPANNGRAAMIVWAVALGVLMFIVVSVYGGKSGRARLDGPDRRSASAVVPESKAEVPPVEEVRRAVVPTKADGGAPAANPDYLARDDAKNSGT